jgi:hypothetical protein
MYLLGRRLHSGEAGLVAALLTAVSSHNLQYSQQVRGYALGFLAAAIGLYALVRLTDRWLEPDAPARKSLPDLALYTAAASLAIYTHTTFFLLPLLANLYFAWVWWFRSRRDLGALAAWILANAAILVICSWWIWITYQQLTTAGGTGPISWLERPSLKEALLQVQRLFFTRRLGLANYPAALLLIAVAGWGLWRMRLERRVLLVLFCAGVPGLLYLISLKQPVYLDRTLFWALAAFIPALGAGIAALPFRRLVLPAAIALASIWLLDAVIWRGHVYREPWRDIGEVIAARAKPGDVLLGPDISSMVNFEYYCRSRCAALPHLAVKRSAVQEVLRDEFGGSQVEKAHVRAALGGAKRVWVIHRGRGPELDQLLAGVAVEEDANVLKSDPLVEHKPGRNARMRLSNWRVADR